MLCCCNKIQDFSKFSSPSKIAIISEHIQHFAHPSAGKPIKTIKTSFLYCSISRSHNHLAQVQFVPVDCRGQPWACGVHHYFTNAPILYLMTSFQFINKALQQTVSTPSSSVHLPFFFHSFHNIHK
jgi:hypothetical protein